MEKANIGFKAGIIFEKLGETGLITIAELARRLNFAADETALAAGWLARENKGMFAVRNTIDVKVLFIIHLKPFIVWISTSSERTQGNSGAY